MSIPSPRIFVSHADKDKQELVIPLVENLLVLGCELRRRQVFCSSVPGMIGMGDHFVNAIFEHLRLSNLLVATVSPNFLQSEFCLAELGAWQMRDLTARKPVTRFALTVPPTHYGDLSKGVLQGVQAGRIDDPSKLDLLHRRILELGGKSDTMTWNRGKELFLTAIAPVIKRRELEDKFRVSLLAVRDAFDKRVPNEDSKITYKQKYRVWFRNETGRSFTISGVGWKMTKARRHGDWYVLQHGEKSTEAQRLTISPDQQFRASIAFDPKQGVEDLIEMRSNNNLGAIILGIECDGVRFQISKAF
jgi:hypothetical protein